MEKMRRILSDTSRVVKLTTSLFGGGGGGPGGGAVVVARDRPQKVWFTVQEVAVMAEETAALHVTLPETQQLVALANKARKIRAEAKALKEARDMDALTTVINAAAESRVEIPEIQPLIRVTLPWTLI